MQIFPLFPFPQPSSVDSVLLGQQSFRLTRQIYSRGDIYESESSGLAFALGPDGDISNVTLNYFDDDSTTMVASALLSVGRGMVGRIDARNDAFYPGNRRGRILMYSNDNYDDTWLPSDYVSANDKIDRVIPVIDIIEYFINAPSLPVQRADKNYTFQYFTIPDDAGDGHVYTVIPAYGRKSGFITFKNLGNGIQTVSVSVLGVRYGLSADPGPNGSVATTLLAPADLLADGESTSFSYKASEHGTWDAIVLVLGNGAGAAYVGGPFPTTVSLSDVEA